MKVLKDNYSKKEAVNTTAQYNPYPREIECGGCGSELQYEESDLRMGAYGCMHIDCPLCGYENMLDINEHNIDLTVDNIEFPTHFHHTSTETGAINCCTNEEVKKYIRQAINHFRQNKEEYDWGGHITGNLYIHVHRWSGDEQYEITISNDFHSMDIRFEPEDY